MFALIISVSVLIIACIVSVWHVLGYYQHEITRSVSRRAAMTMILKSFIGR